MNNNYYELFVNTDTEEVKIGLSLETENQIEAEEKLKVKYPCFPVGRTKGVATDSVPKLFDREMEGLMKDGDVIPAGDTSFTMLQTPFGFVGMIAPALWEEYTAEGGQISLMAEDLILPLKLIK